VVFQDKVYRKTVFESCGRMEVKNIYGEFWKEKSKYAKGTIWGAIPPDWKGKGKTRGPKENLMKGKGRVLNPLTIPIRRFQKGHRLIWWTRKQCPKDKWGPRVENHSLNNKECHHYAPEQKFNSGGR